MAARGFLGAGDLYIARMVAGVYENYAGPFECTKFEIKPNVNVLEQTSKGKNTYGQVIETVAIPQPSDFAVDLAEVNKDSLALALLGTTANYAQAAATVSNEAVTADLGAWVPLANRKVSAVVVTNAAGTTTYVAGEDYLINGELGWIKALPGGAILDAAALQVDYTAAAINGIVIAGSTQSQVRAKFKLDGKNFADDLPVIVTVHEGVIAADSAFDFLADNFNTVSLPGRLKTPTGFTEPYTVHMPGA